MKHFASLLVLSVSWVGLATVTMAQALKPVAPDNSAVNVRDSCNIASVPKLLWTIIKGTETRNQEGCGAAAPKGCAGAHSGMKVQASIQLLYP
jgi:hypothetical protein